MANKSVRTTLAWATKKLAKESDTPKLDSELLLALVLNNDRLWLAANNREPLTLWQQRRFTSLVRRRQNGEPIAYLTHQKEFFGRQFYIDRRALIPRPDSEPVIEKIINLLKSKKRPSILEIGTGSGCLAITLAQEIPNCHIVATDISTGALKVAARNNKIHRTTEQVTFKQQDLLTNEDGHYDIVIANLPYVERHWLKESNQARNLSFEPLVALSGGESGLDIVTKFLTQFAKNPIAPLLVLEHGDNQHQAIKSLAKQYIPGYKHTTILDLAKRKRGLILSQLDK